MVLRRHKSLSLEAVQTQTGLDFARIDPTFETLEIISSLHEISAVEREIILKFYLEGYNYAELSQFFGVPLSTVKWRLYNGRKQLQTVFELPKISKESSTMEKLATMQIIAFGYPAKDKRFVVLREVGTYWEINIPITEEEAENLERVLEDKPLPETYTHELMFKMVTSLGAQVSQIVIHKIIEETFYAQVTLKQAGLVQAIEARPLDALVLAVLANAPILIDRAILTHKGENVVDVEHAKAIYAQAIQELEGKIAKRGAETSPIPEPVTVEPEKLRQIENILAGLLDDFKGYVAILSRKDGAIMAWQGTGKFENIARWSLARAQGDHDLHELLSFLIFPADEVGDVIFANVGNDLKLQVALPLPHLQKPMKPLTRGNPENPADNYYYAEMQKASKAIESFL